MEKSHIIKPSEYKKPPILFKRLRKSKTVPNQSLSLQEIMERFTRNIPIDAQQRESVYIDQDEFDYNKMANMSFDEKFAMAAEMQRRAREIDAEFRDDERRRNEAYEAKIKADKDAIEKAAQAAKQPVSPPEGGAK